MLAEGLYQLLSGEPAIQEAVAQMTDQTYAIFPVQMPDECPMPALVTMQIAGAGLPTMDGAEAFHTARIQFSCYGKTFLDAKRLATATRRFLEGYKGTLPDGTEVDSMILVLETDGFEEAPFIFHVPFDLEVSYRDVGD